MQRASGTSTSEMHDHGPPGGSAAPANRMPTQNNVLVSLANKVPQTTINSFCGAVAGAASGIATCPLDVIKTKLQAQGAFRHQQLSRGQHSATAMYKGMIGTARTVVRQDGLRGLYRGLGTMMLGYLPTWAIYMAAYENSREYYRTRAGIENAWVVRVCASVTAGACSTLATNPIWVIKTRMMSQSSRSASDGARTPWHYHSTWDAARKMWRSEGIGAFYSGLSPALLGLTHVAIQFPMYEYLKMRFTGAEMGDENPKQDTWASTLGVLGAAFISKVCATSATYPHEVLRTRLQTQQRVSPAASPDGVSGGRPDRGARALPGGTSSDGMVNRPRYRGIMTTCRVILAEEGWRAFYSGMGTNMIRAVPAAMTTMLTYETTRAAIMRLRDDDGKEGKGGKDAE